MKKSLRALTLIMAAVAVVLGVPQQVRKHPPLTPLRPTQATNRLHELAQKAGGHYILRYQLSHSTAYPNVEELAKRSDLIVVGRTLAHRSKLSADGNFINQDFLVKVQELIKGDIPKGGRSITISLPGGSYMFPDKTFAIVMPMGQEAPTDRTTYVFFLKSPKDSSIKELRLASETQGMFALTGDKVKPSDQAPDNPLVVKYGQMGAADFLKQVHQAVPRKSSATK